jgi:hypothetical protein
MADQLDMAADISDFYLQRSIRAARQPVPEGVEGECQECGDESLRRR